MGCDIICSMFDRNPGQKVPLSASSVQTAHTGPNIPRGFCPSHPSKYVLWLLRLTRMLPSKIELVKTFKL